MENARIVEEFTLPSHGMVYTDIEINPDVVLSSMKTKHEMLRLSSTEESHKIMAEIIDDCLESELGMKSYDLCIGDFQYLLFKLRVVTFGNDYELAGKCPFCGFEQRAVADLDSFPVKEYTEDYDNLMYLELPITGSEVKLTYQTPRMLDKISARVKEYRRRHKDTELNPTLLFSIMSAIDEVDNEVPDALDLEQWIMDLPLADSNAIASRIDAMNNAIGIELLMYETCNVCGTDYIVPFRVNSTFFRPRSE